jgi:hypothetical protein
METQEAGDRALGVTYVKHEAVQKPTYRFGTYDLNDKKMNVYKQIEQEFTTFEGRWFYIYFGYSMDTQQASAFMKDGVTGKVSHQLLNKKKHNQAKQL